jgi:hypothetical protein
VRHEMPGGLWESGTRVREFAFRPVTGALELALAEASASGEPLPLAAARVLSLALESLGGAPAGRERLAGLCSEDRRFLMRSMRTHLGGGRGWRRGTCDGCGKPFDFFLDASDLPVREAPPEYPFAAIRLDGAAWRFRMPMGRDLMAVAGCPDEEEAEWQLLARCWLPAGKDPERAWAKFRARGERAKAAAEAALEAIAPQVTDAVLAACPECGKENGVAVDDYEASGEGTEKILAEVHELALHYHWSEADILGLPRPRRLHYLDLVAKAGDMAR